MNHQGEIYLPPYSDRQSGATTSTMDSRSGAHEGPSPIPEYFLAQQVRSARQPVAPPDFWLPTWVRELVDEGASLEDMLSAISRRVIEAQDSDIVYEIQILLNELGRNPQFTTLLSNYLTQDKVTELLEGE